jgi:hypothetical protein
MERDFALVVIDFVRFVGRARNDRHCGVEFAFSMMKASFSRAIISMGTSIRQ